jgi:hypothetical protein
MVEEIMDHKLNPYTVVGKVVDEWLPSSRLK